MVELSSPKSLPPVTLSDPCETPTDLPVGALNAGDAEALWANDRMALAVCDEKHEALREFYQDRDKGLAGEK